MKILHFLLALMFLGFAYLQLNDPDPLVWVLIYMVMAAFSVSAIFGFYPRRFYWVVLAIFLLYSAVYIPGVIEWMQTDDKSALFSDVAKMEHRYIEESREFLGLMICVAVLVFYIIRSKK